MRSWPAVIFATLSTLGCTRGVVDVDQIPTAPDTRLIALTITPLGGGRLAAGSTVDIVVSGGLPASGVAVGAFAEYSDGTGRYVDASWSSADESILAIIGSSLVGRSRGVVTVTASFEGRTDTEMFLVEGGIQGLWRGALVVEQCTANSASVAEVLCGAPGRNPGLAAIGARLPLTMDLAEMSDNVAATVVLDAARGTLTGPNRGGGFFTVLGTIDHSRTRISVFHWDARVVRDEMEGYIGYEVRITGLPGFGQVAAKFADVVRQ
jgi:hypothetical protein